jgi:RNA polymerase sigma factor (sigma-70 family)
MEELIKDYKNNINKEENFELILEELKPTINKIIYTNMTDRERVAYGIDDLYQEGYIIIYKCLDKFRMNSGVKFKTYFYKAYLNKIRNIKVSKNVKNSLTEQELKVKIIQEELYSFEDIENYIFFKEMNKTLINFWSSDLYQNLYKMRFLQKLKYRSIQKRLEYLYNEKYSISKIHFLCKKIVETIEENWQLLT